MNKKIGMYGGKFAGVIHLGHVYCMTTASTMVDELHVIVSYDTEFEKETLFNGVMKHVDYKHRVRWWKEITKHMKNVFVHSVYETNDNKFESWQAGADGIKKCVGKEITHVFSSEHAYGEFFSKLYPEAEHVVIDSERAKYNISATKIRDKGAFEYWDLLPKVVQKHFVKKVAIIGTESTGKSTLVQNLANLYSTNSVEEYGRTFYEDIDSYETFPSDYLKIAYKQKVLEEEALQHSNKIMFVDTEASVTLRFLEEYHEGDVEDSLVVYKDSYTLFRMILSQSYDLVVLLTADVEWVDDGTRNLGEHDKRMQGHKHLKGILDFCNISYVEVGGNYQERLEKTIELVDNVLENKKEEVKL